MLYMFRACSPIVRSSRRYIHTYCCLLASKQAAVPVSHIPVAVCTVLHSWWWMERPSETSRVLFQNKINLRNWCIWLDLLQKCTHINMIYTCVCVLFVTQQCNFDPCCDFAAGRQTTRCWWPVTDVYQLKIHWSWKCGPVCKGGLILFCEREFSFLFSLIRTVHEFVFRLVTNWTTNQQAHVLDSFMLPLHASPRDQDPHPCHQGQTFTPEWQ
jgi:hypothetical protein